VLRLVVRGLKIILPIILIVMMVEGSERVWRLDKEHRIRNLKRVFSQFD
jgi:hypothetical protein